MAQLGLRRFLIASWEMLGFPSERVFCIVLILYSVWVTFSAAGSSHLSGREHACFVAQSRPTFCDPVDCSPPGSSVLGISQGRTLEWVAIPSFRASY